MSAIISFFISYSATLGQSDTDDPDSDMYAICRVIFFSGDGWEKVVVK